MSPEVESDAGDPVVRSSTVGGRNLPVAIAVGVLLVGLFVGSVIWAPLAFTALVAALATVAYIETGAVLRGIGQRIEIVVLLVSTMVLLFGTHVAGHSGQSLGVLVLVLGSVLWMLGDARRRRVVRSLALTLLFGLWVGFFASFAVLLVNRPDGAMAVSAVVGAAVLSDIGGYGFGVAFGRHKVAPSVSPNKTWEGLIGGLLVAILGVSVLLPLLWDDLDVLSAAAIALTCGLAGFLGDLMESMLKRDLGVKDLGAVLPGHGGVLDRVDGILLALPVGYFMIELLV